MVEIPPPPHFFWFVYLRHLSTLFGVYCKLDGEYEGRCGCDLPPPPPPFVYLRHLSTFLMCTVNWMVSVREDVVGILLLSTLS